MWTWTWLSSVLIHWVLTLACCSQGPAFLIFLRCPLLYLGTVVLHLATLLFIFNCDLISCSKCIHLPWLGTSHRLCLDPRVISGMDVTVCFLKTQIFQNGIYITHHWATLKSIVLDLVLDFKHLIHISRPLLLWFRFTRSFWQEIEWSEEEIHGSQRIDGSIFRISWSLTKF